MPGVDLLVKLGATPFSHVDAGRLQRVHQRARFDLVTIASQRALSGDLAAGNAEVKQILDGYGAARGWVVVNPSYGEVSTEEMRRYLGSPRWLGIHLHPQLCGQSLSSAPSRELLNSYRRYTKPILVNVPDGSAVRDLEAVAGEFTTIKFIAGGAGGEDWHDCALAAKRYTNVFLEPFSGCAHRGKLEAILQLVGAHRVMFASAFPDRNPGASLGLLVDSGLSDGEKQAILGGSAVKLFGLTRPE